MDQPISAIVGLGNPGSEHAGQRHNAGYWLVEALAAGYGGRFRPEGKFEGELAKIELGDKSLWLLKPTTFMNRSGRSVQAFASYYKLQPENLLIVHDDLDLPPGTARLKRGGGHGGHNGLRSLSQHLGADFCRLRLGIGHPGHKDQVLGYVLARPTGEQERQVVEAIERAVDALAVLITEGWEKATTLLHSSQVSKSIPSPLTGEGQDGGNDHG